SGANPIACSTPSRRPPTLPASASRCAGSVTSSSRMRGSSGSRRAARWVKDMTRPNDVRMTSAPSSYARRATLNAVDASLRTPVTRIRFSLSSVGVSQWCVRMAAGGLRLALVDEDVERVAQHPASCARLDHDVDEATFGGTVRVLERRPVLLDELGIV